MQHIFQPVRYCSAYWLSTVYIRPIFQFDLSPISLGQDSYVLEDLVAQPPDVEVVADVLHQLEDQLRLVQGLEAGVNLY